MRKEFLFVVLIVGVLLIAGCNTGDDETPEGPFVGGNGGVVVDFSDGAPLTEFDQGEEIPFKVKLTNLGEFDIPAGDTKAKLFGFTNFGDLEIDTFKGTDGILYGVSKIREEGGEQVIDFGTGSYDKDVVGEFTELTLHSMVCYPYETNTNTRVCMSSRRISETEGEEVCSVNGEKAISGATSAAPIQITSITEEFKGSNSLLFKIIIQNEGGGEVIDKDVNCEDYEPLTDKDLVYVNIAPDDLVCDFLEGEQGSSGRIKLTGGSKTLYCEKEVEDIGNSYQDDLVIDLTYKYMDTTSMGVKIYSG